MAPPSDAMDSACTATQAVVDALIKSTEAERLQPADPGASLVADSSVVMGSRNLALAFVAEFVAAGRATVQLADAVPILECLASPSRVCSCNTASAHLSNRASFWATCV